jgi:hypothetical protein
VQVGQELATIKKFSLKFMSCLSNFYYSTSQLVCGWNRGNIAVRETTSFNVLISYYADVLMKKNTQARMDRGTKHPGKFWPIIIDTQFSNFGILHALPNQQLS